MPERKQTKPSEPKGSKAKQPAKAKKASRETARKTASVRGWSDRNIKGHVVAVTW